MQAQLAQTELEALRALLGETEGRAAAAEGQLEPLVQRAEAAEARERTLGERLQGLTSDLTLMRQQQRRLSYQGGSSRGGSSSGGIGSAAIEEEASGGETTRPSAAFTGLLERARALAARLSRPSSGGHVDDSQQVSSQSASRMAAGGEGRSSNSRGGKVVGGGQLAPLDPPPASSICTQVPSPHGASADGGAMTESSMDPVRCASRLDRLLGCIEAGVIGTQKELADRVVRNRPSSCWQ